ncbi:MAG: nucleotide exchange factor GrpE [Candidatus Gracilibacteria bacterium]
MPSDPAIDPQIVEESPSESIENSGGSTGQGAQGNDTDPNVLFQELQNTIIDLREQLARAQSDYSNLIRRSREESAQIGPWVEDKTILKFLPILDNLERALEHIPEDFVKNNWVEGIGSIVRGMQKVVSDFGITPMDSVGQEVNPDLHDVISQVPHALSTIQVEVEKGYMRGEKALRHAKVIVGDGQLSSE